MIDFGRKGNIFYKKFPKFVQETLFTPLNYSIMIRSVEPFLRLKRKCNLYQGDALQIFRHLLPRHGRVVVLTDETIEREHPELLGDFPRVLLGKGENAKSLTEVSRVCLRFMRLGVDRSWTVLAIGGGVVSDLAGFIASIYMRGVRFGFVPTTLLAQVDASVGGKNGVNLGGYKNMVGCFRQPDFVVCDSMLLRTLPIREFRAGMAEVIKAAIIGNPTLFEELLHLSNRRMRSGFKHLDYVIRAAIEVKAEIVSRDEKEQGERKLLNLGHTFAHAIEKWSGGYNHGEAVSVGIMIACRISEKLGLISGEEVDLIARQLGDHELPLRVPSYLRPKLLRAIQKDKKRAGEKIAIILPKSIGECVIHPVTFEELEELFPKECGYC